MLTVHVNHPERIERRANQVARYADSIKESRPVRNLGSSVRRWAESPEVREYQALEDEFLATPRGQRMQAEWEDVFRALGDAVQPTEQHGIHINNAAIPALEDELHDVGDQYEALDRTQWP